MTGDFFLQSCVPGAKTSRYDPNGDNPDNLCELCIGVGDSNCARSQEEPYYDYSGSFRCLAEGAGDVAFVKHTTVLDNTDDNTPPEWGLNASSSDYKLLCEDGTTESDVSNYIGCNLATVPSHGVMTSGDKSNSYVQSVETLLTDAQKMFGSDQNVNGFKMFDSSAYGGTDLLFLDSTQALETLGNRDTYEEYLGKEYLEALRAITCDNGAGLLRGSLALMVLLVLIVLGLK
ncbi:melanotransferrin-like [Amphiura filiformis]|uniref:melanotransferrin-like n=1 Tax=Amphiura filiformis TaxID=82378 RepID=UPI003B21A277